ncbi:MAG: hypothetical protein OXM01_03725 [Gemmatimonadota bacterium]|nr:hypothetical protein [Gemmatimonadota bacterium]
MSDDLKDWRNMYCKAKNISENADIMQGAPYTPIKELAAIVAELEIEKQFQDRAESIRLGNQGVTDDEIRRHLKKEREREKSRGDTD